MANGTQSPLIGITCEAVATGSSWSNYELVCDHRYADAVKDAGGHPVLLPIVGRKSMLRRTLEGIDGLVIVGGDDVDPRLYGEVALPTTNVIFPGRSRFERWLYRAGKRRGLPTLGICYGMQLINVLEGGSLYQTLPRRRGIMRVDHGGRHPATHGVHFIAGTRLAAITPLERGVVAAEHHQAVRDLAPGFIPAAFADDGLVEAIENPDLPNVLAVQWHPERRRRSNCTRRLLRAFVERAAAYQARSK